MRQETSPSRAAVPRHALLFVVILWARGAWAQGRSDEAAFRDVVRPLVISHCTGCHGPERPKAGIDLSRFSDGDAMRSEPEPWRRAVGALRLGSMPPRQKEGFLEDTREHLVGGIRAVLNFRDPNAAPDPGLVTLRRLDRYEYDRTVLDLLGVVYDSSRTFPAEPSAYGFDNMGDVLFLTPMLLEKYFDATEEILDRLADNAKARSSVFGDAGASGNPTPVHAWLQPFLRRAFRRPVTEEEVLTRRALMQGLLDRNEGLDRARRAALTSILLSPHFLFRVEAERPQPEPWRLLGWEVATRLSYLLWSAPPDAALDALAESGALLGKEVLERQVDRMLKDPRARALADHFAAQWLGFRAVLTHAVDFRRFPGFDGALRHAMYEESARFFMAVVSDDATLLDLIDSKFTYANERLARHYGIEGVRGGEIRRVTLPKDTPRGGVLGMASILCTTSYGLRTSPVLRGKWILETLVGAPPPPPPADAGVLPEDDHQKDGLSLRARLELHRREARCASCHARMDPLGLALETFDGVGAFRTESQGQKLDVRVESFGETLDGPRGVRQWLMRRRDDVLRTITESFLIYALGRPTIPADEPVMEDILASVAREGYRFSALVKGVVTSYPFLHRRKP